jgi:DNA polymerase III subunit gamma/tau
VLSGQWRVEAVHGTGGDAAAPARPEPARQRPEPPRRPERPRQEQPPPERSAEAPREQARESGPREIRRPSRPAPGPSDVPPPPEPPPEDGDVTEEDMYNEAAADPGGAAGGVRVDPEEAAMELLTSQLGARRVDGR